MDNMELEKKKTKSNICKNCGGRILIVLVAVLSITTVVFLGLYARKVHTENLRKEFTPENLKERFPGYFKTKEEQEIRERQTKFVPVTKTELYNNRSCFLSNITCYETGTSGLPSPARRKRATQSSILSSCCQGSQGFISPVKQDNTNGVLKEFVQINDALQFFEVTECSTVKGCSGCNCFQKQTILTAVVYKVDAKNIPDVTIDDAEVDSFYFQTCCQCINIV